MNTRFALVPRITVLFVVSFFFLALHVLDDALSTGEPAQYGVSIPEFLFYAALIYAIVPPLGLFWARRGHLFGVVIVAAYGFQAMYGAGLNHVRHMFGDFSGSRLLPTLLGDFGIHLTDIRGYGFGSVLMGMAGLGQTPPHTHTIFSALIAFIDIGLNLVLVGMCLAAIFQDMRSSFLSSRLGERYGPGGMLPGKSQSDEPRDWRSLRSK